MRKRLFTVTFSVKVLNDFAIEMDQGTFVIHSLGEIGDNGAADSSWIVENLVSGLYRDTTAIAAARTCQNETSSVVLPPVCHAPFPRCVRLKSESLFVSIASAFCTAIVRTWKSRIARLRITTSLHSDTKLDKCSDTSIASRRVCAAVNGQFLMLQHFVGVLAPILSISATKFGIYWMGEGGVSPETGDPSL
jgi:hypothetical protein